MDRREQTTNFENSSSLGILNMENLRVFGDSSLSCSSSGDNKNRLSERLKMERLKAQELLESKSARNSVSKMQASRRISSTQNFERSDYIRPNRQPNSFNISDLITDETININSSSSIVATTPADKKKQKISFEPAEITGRSTIFVSGIPAAPAGLSVAEILESSMAEKALELGKRMQQQKNSAASSRRASALSNVEKSFTSYNDSRSLPRTADLSSFNGGDFEFNASRSSRQNDSENFEDANLMHSKLLQGEISWAQEYAAIPTAALSNEAKARVTENYMVEIDTSASNSILNRDPNYSLGKYFYQHSDDVCNMVKLNSLKYRTPSAMFEDSARDKMPTSSRISNASSALLTPVPENKTYTKVETATKLERGIFKNKIIQNQQLQPKKSDNLNDASYMLSLSAIDRALNNFDLDTDSSSVGVINHLLLQGKKSKAIETKQPSIMDFSSDNKENIDSTLVEGDCRQSSDTMSMNESLLNSSDHKKLQSTNRSIRTPLSPLTDLILPQPDIQITECGHDADTEEYPSTPIKGPNKRVKRRKSPNSVSPNQNEARNMQSENEDSEKTPINKQHSIVTARPKSLCSTRFDINTNSAYDCDFRISPNFSKHSPASSITASYANSNMLSPHSSPRSCTSSPQLDNTTNSDRRLLMPCAVRKTNSSPVASEASSTTGAVYKSNVRGNKVAARSISRCSNSSEFSHRDGKSIPLKVTELQLCWGSTKLRTDVRKSMQIKNIAEKRLVIRIAIRGPGFQLVNNDSNTITLQPQECRSITINFFPTMCGTAVGVLSFHSPLGAINMNASFMDIPLYAYGGNASVMVHGLLKGPVGSSFLPIGDVCTLADGPLETFFTIYNKGPLQAYASISIDSTILMKARLCDAFLVQPSSTLIPPNSEVTVRLIFQPKREDIRKITKKISQVLTLANMRIICGDEPNRQRMRALVQRMSTEQRVKLNSATLDNLWVKFPGEHELRDLRALKDQPEVVLDFITAVRIHEVALTLNRNLNESSEASSLFLPEADETVLFRTICATNSPTPTAQYQNMLDPVDELDVATMSLTGEPEAKHYWSVSPTTIELDTRSKKRISFYVKNSFKSSQYFEVTCNQPQLLRLTPSEGYVASDGGETEVEVLPIWEHASNVEIAKQQNIVISINMENERITIPVQFIK